MNPQTETAKQAGSLVSDRAQAAKEVAQETRRAKRAARLLMGYKGTRKRRTDTKGGAE